MAQVDIDLFSDESGSSADSWPQLARQTGLLLACIRREIDSVEAWIKFYEFRRDDAVNRERERLRRWREQQARHEALLEQFRALSATLTV